LTICFSQDSAATDLRGGGRFTASYSRRSFLDLTVTNYQSWSTFAEFIVKIKVTHFFETRGKSGTPNSMQNRF